MFIKAENKIKSKFCLLFFIINPSLISNSVGFESRSANILSTPEHLKACGRKFSLGKVNKRIVNGDDSKLGSQPWQIYVTVVESTTNKKMMCGGALLNENWAITAGHCLNNAWSNSIILRMGDLDLSSFSEPLNFQERKISAAFIHPQYGNSPMQFDAALIKFDRPVKFQANIMPICLPSKGETFVNRMGYVSGWGKMETGQLSPLLQEVQVPIISNYECQQDFAKIGIYPNPIFNSDICAGHKEGYYDACQGDSGGPLTAQRKDGRWELAGIVSWSVGCARPHVPGVYTRVTALLDWIDQTIRSV